MPCNYDALFWDLDGTLLDTSPGILISLRYALAELGIPAEEEAALRRLIGPPMEHTMQHRYGLNQEDAARGLALFRQRHHAGAALIAEEYPGMRALLRDLQRAGCTCYVVTFKPQMFADMLLAKEGYDQYFAGVRGIGLDKLTETKGELLRRCMREWGCGPGRYAMIGDRSFDIAAARDAGVEGIAVTWGFGDAQELENLPVAYTAQDVTALRARLLR